MKIVKLDRKHSFLEVVPESLDDLWHLERIVEKGDLVSGKTERKIKPKEEGAKPMKIDMFIEVEAEAIEFHKYSGKLRVNGVIVRGKPEELVELKAHHTVEIEPNRKVGIKKKKLKKYQLDRLEKARKASAREKMLLVVLDDEEAGFAMVKEFELEKRGKVFSRKGGKMYEVAGVKEKYFSEIMKKVEDSGAEKVVFAGPGFTKDNLKKYVEDKGLKARAYFESTNSTGITGMNELVGSGAIEKIARQLQLSVETGKVERLFEEIGKGSGLAEYGRQEVGKAVEIGAVKELLITDKKMLEQREEAEKLMEKAEELGGEVHIINQEHDAGQRLKGLGGIAVLLRYKVR